MSAFFNQDHFEFFLVHMDERKKLDILNGRKRVGLGCNDAPLRSVGWEGEKNQ